MEIDKFLRVMVEEKASDLYFKAHNYPYLRIEGKMSALGEEKLTSNQIEELARKVMGEGKWREFLKNLEIDLAYETSDRKRFRVNVFRQRGNVGMVFRRVKEEILTFEELNLPVRVLEKLSLEPRGLVLISGIAGSGKSTTLAAMIEYINTQKEVHIVTIEDPIEFIHQDKKSVIEQREVGIDTPSFASALRHVVRQSPDVILIGEMRDKETMLAAISAAETGHLVLSTLHTFDATQTVERIINFFPPYQHPQIRMQLSFVLKGVISQRLIPRASGEGRIPAVEVMLSTPTIQKLILEGRTSELYRSIESGSLSGMQTFNQSLLELYRKGWVKFEEALSASDNPTDFELKAKGIYSGSRAIKEARGK